MVSRSTSYQGSETEKGSDIGEPASKALYNPHVDVSDVDEQKLMRKVDLALVPWLSFLYLLSFLDRTSIGNAKLYHLTRDIHLTDHQYLLGLTVFFFSYAVFEVPSNIFLKRLRPSIWLSLLMLCWGAVMTFQGFVRNYHDLLAVRFLLGIFEAGLFPGVNYYLSCWYKRSEFGVRSAFFFTAASVSGAFGGLLAAAISNMDGIGHKHGWSWIFILEGLATVVASAASFFIIQDFPEDARFLSEAERTVIIRRLQEDNQLSAGGENLRSKYIFQSWSDWKTWVTMFIYAGCVMPLYAFSLFLPTIISQLGYHATKANLLTVPVYFLAGIFTVLVNYIADRKPGHRAQFNCLLFCVAGAGYIILLASKKPALSYFAVFLGASGIYPMIPNTIAWISNNVEGSYKRGVSLAMVIGFGNLNGAVSSNVYRARDAPRFHLGHGIVLMYIGIGFIASVISWYFLKSENARRDRGERDEIIGDENSHGKDEKNGRFHTIDDARREKGDQWSGYRYEL